MSEYQILKDYFHDRAKKAAKARWKNKTIEEKRLHSLLMVQARKKKQVIHNPPLD